MSDRCACCGCLLELFEGAPLCLACEVLEQLESNREDEDDAEGDEC